MPIQKVNTQEIANTGVTAGTYEATTITVSEDGRVTAAANGSPAIPNILMLSGM
jgi:hypothetical protein